MEKHELAGKRIIVAGAGIAGLAFASALERYWPAEHPKPEVILYERSTKILDRQKQGYTMSIKPESGLKALKELGLVDDALRDSNVGKDGTPDLPIVWNKDWQPMFDPNATSKKQIDQFGFPRNARLVRYKLRDLLLNALPTDTKVHWELGCASAQRLENGRTRVTLTDSTTEDCDLLVACDGANSSIRSSMLPNESLSYAGVVCFIGTSLFPNGKPDMFKNNWGLNITGKGLAFLVFPVDATTGAWGFSYKSDQPRDRIRGEEAIERRREILDEIQSRGRMIGEPFNQFVEATDPATLQVFSAMHKSPIVHAQKMAAANVVFIGDSNHPMSPFSGNGANMALMDAVALAQQLSNCTTVRKAISNFDAESAPRSQKAIDRGRFTIRLLHVKGIAFWLFSAFLSLLGFLMRAMKRIR